jgi:DGQHR domain-containing protein
MYSAAIPAGALLDRVEVDEWSDKHKDGYQRAVSAARLREVAAYVRGNDAIMPLSGLLNARADMDGSYGKVLEFSKTAEFSPEISVGMLTLPDPPETLKIVDMQHRLGGIGLAIESGLDELREFPVIATISDGLSKMEEVEQFELINTTQKKVRTDLARRLLSLQANEVDRRVKIDRKGRLWEATGPTVVDWLNTKGQIWKGRIMPPNKSKAEMPKAIVRETSFVTSLKPILQGPFYRRMQEAQVAELIDRFWQAVARLWPECFVIPEDYVIQKTPGVFCMHALAPEVIELVRAKNLDLSVANLLKAMEGWKSLESDFWAADGDGAAKYGSMKGFTQLAADLREHLPDADGSLL